jgi:hypothetical protein
MLMYVYAIIQNNSEKKPSSPYPLPFSSSSAHCESEIRELASTSDCLSRMHASLRGEIKTGHAVAVAAFALKNTSEKGMKPGIEERAKQRWQQRHLGANFPPFSELLLRASLQRTTEAPAKAPAETAAGARMRQAARHEHAMRMMGRECA